MPSTYVTKEKLSMISNTKELIQMDSEQYTRWLGATEQLWSSYQEPQEASDDCGVHKEERKPASEKKRKEAFFPYIVPVSLL